MPGQGWETWQRSCERAPSCHGFLYPPTTTWFGQTFLYGDWGHIFNTR